MNISVFDLFKIGIGPSSSHTVGPMYAAKQFLFNYMEKFPLDKIASLKVELFGSLAFTGKGHGTDTAILMGLEGNEPASVDTEQIPARLDRIHITKTLSLMNEHSIPFEEKNSLIFNHDDILPHHSNGMRFKVFDTDGNILHEEDFYSVGGGFILNGEEIQNEVEINNAQIPFPFKTCEELFIHCERTGMTCRELMWINEQTWRTESEIWEGLLDIWSVMQECTQRGMSSSETLLPGGLNVRRRAPGLHKELTEKPDSTPSEVMDWVSLFAIAVNEENAAGGRMVLSLIHI